MHTKFRNTITLLLCGTLMFLQGCTSAESQVTVAYETMETNEPDYSENGTEQLFAVADSIGAGWNIGNSLDSCDYNRYNSDYNHITACQIMASYSTNPYSSWDAGYSGFASYNGNVELSWNIEELESRIDGECGSFSIQILDSHIDSTASNALKYTVNKAEFIKEDGTVVSFDNLIGDYETSIEEGTGKCITVDLTKYDELNYTSDIVGGSLNVSITITEAPKNTSSDEEVTSTNDYYESLWGNPVITKELIDKIKEAGFTSVRIPVTYYDHILDDNYTIDSKWLDRVEEVVNYVLDNDMYCIINVHHDAGQGTWLRADMDSIDKSNEILTALWTQIGQRFMNYDNRLLFEGFNEILNNEDDWTGTSDDYKAVNILNQTFVNTVRAIGGNNSSRYLVVNTYAAGCTEAILKDFEIPTDTIENHIMAEVHAYVEYDTKKIDTIFARLEEKFIDNNVPVVIGEYGVTEHEWQVDFAKYYTAKAKSLRMAYIWWDNGSSELEYEKVTNFALINRRTLEWYNQDLINALVE